MRSRNDPRQLVIRALGLGFAGGLRSWPPLAALMLTYDRAPATAGWKRWPVLRSPWGRRALIVLGVLEPIADKWPGTQSRLSLKPQLTHTDGGLIGRVAVDTLAAAALGSEYRVKNSVALGAAVGAAGALVGNYAGYSAREAVKRSTGLPDPTVGTIEDEVCIGLLTAVVGTR